MSENFDAYMFFVGRGKYMAKQGSSYKEQAIGRIEGEALDAKYREKGAFAITSFQWACGHETIDDDPFDSSLDLDNPEAEAPKRKPKLIGQKNKKPVVGAFSVSKDVDLATPMLFKANSTGSEFPAAHIYFRKSGGGTKLFPYLHLIFGITVIESWSLDLPGTRQEEKMTVRFKWCNVMYYPQQADGTRNKGKLKSTEYCSMPGQSEPPPEMKPMPDVWDMFAS